MCHKHYAAAKAQGELPGQALCSVEGCGKGIAGQGLCQRHYYAARKAKIVPVATCSVAGCELSITAKGLCYTHYYEARVRGEVETTICGVEGCGKPTTAFGLCRSHYKQAKYRGEIQGRKCSISGCDRNTTARGLCQSHYSQALTADAFPDMARCQWEGCKRRAKKEGYCVPHFSKAPSPELRCQFDGCERKFVERGYCRFHIRIVLILERKAEEAAIRREERARRREAKRQEWLAGRPAALRLYRYGLTEPDFERLMESQGRSCAICGVSNDAERLNKTRSKGLVVDHDHASGEVRGLLCGWCNRGIGGFRDNPELVASAIRYLENPPALSGATE